MYRVGFPLWKQVARLGFPVLVRVQVHHDKDSNSFWAESPDLDGLVVSGESLDEVRTEVQAAAGELISLAMAGKSARAETELRLRDEALCGA